MSHPRIPLAIIIAALAGTVPRAQDTSALALGAAIDRPLAAGETHSYQLALRANDFVRITVAQKGIDVVATLTGPDGRDLFVANAEADPFREEVVVAVANTGGSHALVVRPPNGARPAGRYLVTLDEMRPATSADARRIEAEKAFGRGEVLTQTHRANVYPEALREYLAALEAFRELGDRRREMKALIEIAVMRFELRHPEFFESAQEAARVAREVGDQAALVTALRGVGMAFESRGDLVASLREFEQATAISREIGHRAAEAASLNDEGINYGRRGESEQAIARFERARSLGRETGVQVKEMEALQNLGIAYKNIGEFEKSLDAYRRVLTEYRDLEDYPDRKANLLNNMGNVEHLLGRDREALDLHEQALRIARDSGSKDNEARSLNTIGQTYYALGEHDKALAYHRDSLAIRRQIGDLPGQAASLAGEGRALNRLGHRAEALAALRESLALRRQIRERGGELETLANLAEVERDRGNIAEAVAESLAAVGLEQVLREQMTSPAFRASFGAFQHARYELLIDLLLQQHRIDPSGGHDAEGFDVAERARARVLLESLLDARVDLRQGIDSALLERERALEKQLNDASTQLSRTLAAKNAAAGQADTIARKLEQVSQDYEQLQGQIRRQSPHYAAVMQPQPLTSREIQQTLLDDDTVLIEFALGDERSWLWAVTPHDLASFALPPRKEIEGAVRSLYQQLIARQRKPRETSGSYAERVRTADVRLATQARDVSLMLFGNVADRLNGEWQGKRLAIVAGGALEYLPFAALPVPESAHGAARAGSARHHPRLVDQHEVVNIPSASVLSVLRRETINRPPAARTVAIFADPVFESADPRVAARSASRRESSPIAPSRSPVTFDLAEEYVRRAGVGRLLFSREEADAIAALAAPGSQGRRSGTEVTDAAVLKAVDFNASRTTALDRSLNDFRIVHFATHGVLDAERPSLSGLVLSLVDERGAPQNGYLRLHDIYNMQLNADLVVLSACQTALGKEIKGEGLVGLTRAFMYAGAPRVVASLWEVSDVATTELMKRFYRRMLRDSLPAAAALRAAQIEMARDPRWSSPYFWAGFVLQGDWQ